MVKSSALSKRENEVIELLLRGMSNKQIALSLGISASTVEFHLKNVYAKLGVHSRTEVILKLGKSTGVVGAKPQETIVEIKSQTDNTRENFFFKELEMRKRILYYFFTGLLFGAVYWSYLNVTAGFFGEINTNMEPGAVSGMTLWVLMSVMFLVVFGVWLIPTIAPAVYEYRRSGNVGRSVLAVVVVWVSGVFGYYLTYVVLLAFFGLPNMDHLLILGNHSSTFWSDWGRIFNKLILYSFLRWSIVGIVVGGFAGYVTSSIYSFWVKRTGVVVQM